MNSISRLLWNCLVAHDEYNIIIYGERNYAQAAWRQLKSLFNLRGSGDSIFQQIITPLIYADILMD